MFRNPSKGPKNKRQYFIFLGLWEEINRPTIDNKYSHRFHASIFHASLIQG